METNNERMENKYNEYPEEETKGTTLTEKIGVKIKPVEKEQERRGV